jgi:hypothetical protein
VVIIFWGVVFQSCVLFCVYFLKCKELMDSFKCILEDFIKSKISLLVKVSIRPSRFQKLLFSFSSFTYFYLFILLISLLFYLPNAKEDILKEG